MSTLIRVFAVRRVPVYVHWSVFAITLFFLGVAWQHILPAAIGIASYLGVLLVHELGHQYVATRRQYRVMRIEIYPIHGVCRFESPEYPLDAAAIAWGGVLAQFAIAIPCILYIKLVGHTPFLLLNIPLAIFAFLNPVIAVLNLLPIAPLDGKLAWTYFKYRFAGVRWRRRGAVEEKTPLQALREAAAKAQQR